MAVRIIRLGSPRAAGEGLRIGTVRRPPRGVPKTDFAKRDYYDVWLPTLSPSEDLLVRGKAAAEDKAWKEFSRRYRAEMKSSDPSRLLDLLAALSRQTNFSVGCYCAEESRCHRLILRELLVERDAEIAG